MDNGNRILSNLNADVDQILSSSEKINSANSKYYLISKMNHYHH
jgi:hypothetical protein